jgi:hypothetical protein
MPMQFTSAPGAPAKSKISWGGKYGAKREKGS